MAYDAVCFDMDGVLLTGYHTDRSVYRRAVRATLADFGVSYEGDPPPDLVDPDTVTDVRTVCDDLDLPAAPAWAYRERAATTLENESIVAGDRHPFSDTGALRTLAESYELTITSNNRQGTVRFAAEHFGWPISAVRGRYPTLRAFGSRKPDPEIVTSMLDHLDTDDAVLVGDRRSDVEAAHRAGIDAVLLARDGDPPEGDPEPEYHVESLSELPDVLE